MSRRIPDWVLERYAAGEALPEGFGEEELAADPSVAERLAALRRSDAEILERLPPGEVAREVRRRRARRAERPGERRGSLARWAPMLVTAGVAAAVVIPLAVLIPVLLSRPADDGGVRSKGLSPHLEVYRQAGQGAEALSPGAPVRAGDVLQLRIIGAGERFAAVVSVDGAGGVTLHAPERPGASLALPASGGLTLGQAYALDAAPRFERFILVTSGQPFDAGRVVSAARALGADPSAPLALPPDLRQASFVVKKEPR